VDRPVKSTNDHFCGGPRRCFTLSIEREREDALEAEDIKEKDADGLLGIACGVCLSL